MTEIELTAFLFELADLDITGIKVKYDGAGDSGAIEWIGFTKEPCETPEDVNDIIADWTTENNLADYHSKSYNTIENFAYEMLDEIEDWWNNEGGYGDLCMCVPSGKYIINNHIRITDTEDYFHDGDLFTRAVE